jgi:peroxiredoxin
MNLKKAITFIAICLIITNSIAQESPPATFKTSTTSTFQIDENTHIYNKETGERMDFNLAVELINKNSGVSFEKKYNERGEVTTLIYDPGQIHTGKVTRDIALRTKPNEHFPDFIFTTLEGGEIGSRELRGKIIVLYFNLFLKQPFISEKMLFDFDKVIQDSPLAKEITSIFLTASSGDDSKKFTDQVKINYPIVPNATNFNDKYIVTKLPSYIIINRDGTLNGYVDDLEELKKSLMELDN